MPTTLAEFLQSLGVMARFFDCGRRISDLSGREFSLFESNAIAYPAPYLHHAWIGLLFWAPATPEAPSLWFLKFPLDEQGQLVPAARDAFLQQLLMTVGTNLQALQDGEQLKGILEGNPYTFTPTPERQACLHARARQALQQQPSQHLQPALDYLRSDNLDNWQHLSVQGLADIAIHCQQYPQLLAAAIPKLPEQPLITLAQCLENAPLCDTMGAALLQRMEREREMPMPAEPVLSALIRALSAAPDHASRQHCLLGLLAQATPAPEVVISIATRCSGDMHNQALCLAFLEALAQISLSSEQNTGASIFHRVLADLLYVPSLRQVFNVCFQHPACSPQLQQAIAGLLSATG